IESQFLKYVIKHKIKTDLEYVYDEQLNYLLEDIIKEPFYNEFDKEKHKDIINSLINIKSNDDIKGVILLTLRGNVIYSSLNDIKLKPFLKEVDFRVKISNNSILKLFYTSKNEELIFSENVNDLFIVMLIFESKIKFGMAEFYLRKVVRKIKNLIAM
ncbi:MAG: hypothetical protein ACTSQW_01195, partial [Promethearchaeota archaeon]